MSAKGYSATFINGLDASLCPFSRSSNHLEILALARELVKRIQLSAEIGIVEGNGAFGLERERFFRLRWWDCGDDQLRAGLQNAKRFLYLQAQQTPGSLESAWLQAEQVANSERWRQHFKEIAEGQSTADAAFLRLAFVVSQQAWSRALRWRLTLGSDEASPFLPLIKLLACGAWPLGCFEGTLWVFVWNPKIENKLTFGPTLPIATGYAGRQADGVFLSAKFRDGEFTDIWKEALHQRGWKPFHSHVCEDLVPTEFQLGRRIRSACAVVGLVKELDPDFGLSWWILQECDFARACGRPLIIISQNGTPKLALEDLYRVYAGSDSQPHHDHEIWQALEECCHD